MSHVRNNRSSALALAAAIFIAVLALMPMRAFAQGTATVAAPAAPTVVVPPATALPMPTLPPTFTTSAPNPGLLFWRENKHRGLCAPTSYAIPGGTGTVDFDELFKSLGVAASEVNEIFFVPVTELWDFDDLDDTLDDYLTPLTGLTHQVDMASGTYHFGITRFDGSLEIFGIALVIDGQITSSLSVLATSCKLAVEPDDDPVAPTQPVTSTTATTSTTSVAPVAAAPKKKAPVGGHLQSTVFNEENKRLFAALFVLGLFVLACIGVYGFTQYQKRQRKLATTTR